MKRFLIACLLYLALASCDRPQLTVWEDVCRLTADVYSCEGIQEPTVVYMDMPAKFKGRYFGGAIVYLSTQFKSAPADYAWQIDEVTFHEFVHYLQWSHGRFVVPDTIETICQIENEALMITDIYVQQVLKHPEAKRWPNWTKHYPLCKVYYP